MTVTDAIQTARAKALNRADLYARWERTPQAAQALAERANLCDDIDELIIVVERETKVAMPCYEGKCGIYQTNRWGPDGEFGEGVSQEICQPCTARIDSAIKAARAEKGQTT